MTDAILLTPREIATGAPSLHNERVVVTDEEYSRLEPALRQFYEKVRENLGLGCITGQLRAAGYSTTALNLHGRNPSDARIEELVRHERPAFVGVSVMYDLHIVDAVRIVRAVRRAHPEAFVAVGGAFCTYNASLIASHLDEADCVAFGEAERTVVGLLDALGRGSGWRDVPGIAYRTGDSVVTTGNPELPDLATLAWPARDTLLQHRAAGIPTPVASTFSSRGCHAKCTFCYAPRQPGAPGNPWRVRPAASVVDEIEMLQRDFGTRFLWFNDDNFGGAFAEGCAHAVEIAEELIRRDLDISFHCEFRVDSGLIDREVLTTLKRAGMASALLGIESGSPSMLRRFKKGVTADYNVSAARMFKDLGLGLDPGWIMIDPKTTLDELWENLAFIVTTGVHETPNPFFLVNRAITLRGTEMYDSVTDPVPNEDLGDLDDASAAILESARRSYRVADARVESLWRAWSTIGGDLSERRENELPFLAQAVADAVRRARSTGGPSPRHLLGALRAWLDGLPELFVAFLTTGLVLADEDPPDLDFRLETSLGALVEAYELETLGAPYAAFVERLHAECRPTASVVGV